MKNFKIFLALLILNISAFSQNFFPPLKGYLKVSGNFAELRKNHFHTGLDFNVGGKIGIPIYAIDDGYLYRVKVSPTGYGKAVYIKHKNGLISVYGHLSKFSNKINTLVKKIQVETEKFSIDYYPDSGKIKISKGEIIGYSGNSGYSFGPHLHFEIREGEEIPLNPQLFNFKIYDNIKPEIKTIVIYPATDTSLVNLDTQRVIKRVQVVSGKYHLNPPIVVYGPFYLGIEAYDYINGINSRNAIYSVKLFADDTLILAYKFDKIPFSLNRSVNSFVDYKLRMTSKYRIQKSLVEPNNKLPIYDSVRNNGIICFNDNKYHTIKYEVADIKGNKRIFEFEIKSTTKMSKYKLRKKQKPFVKKIKYSQDNFFNTSDIEIFIPKNALFSDTVLYFAEKKDSLSGKKYYFIGDEFLPLLNEFYLSIKLDSNLVKYDQKLIIVREDFKGKKHFVGNQLKDGWLTGKSKEFGKFYAEIDTLPPSIKPVYHYQNKNLSSYKRLRFKINDSQSGILGYYLIVNGNWSLAEYDKKTNTLIYNFDSFVKKGKNKIFIGVYDKCWNFTGYELIFYK